MIAIVENNLIDGLGDEIMAAQIVKHFPDCVDCAHENIAQKRHPNSANRVYKIVETPVLDMLEAWSELRATDSTSSKTRGKLKAKKTPILLSLIHI